MSFTITQTKLNDVYIIEQEVFSDDRGFFFESFNEKDFQKTIGKDFQFVQDNFSSSKKNVIRGLHYQIKNPQGKLVRVLNGEVFDVTVDLRVNSRTFGEWYGIKLSAENNKQLWIPEGFAHGFLVLTEKADFTYKTTNYWSPEHERTILWNDTTLNIKWPLEEKPIIASKDANGKPFIHAEHFVDL